MMINKLSCIHRIHRRIIHHEYLYRFFLYYCLPSLIATPHAARRRNNCQFFGFLSCVSPHDYTDYVSLFFFSHFLLVLYGALLLYGVPGHCAVPIEAKVIIYNRNAINPLWQFICFFSFSPRKKQQRHQLGEEKSEAR